jgi:hypothetical protein
MSSTSSHSLTAIRLLWRKLQIFFPKLLNTNSACDLSNRAPLGNQIHYRSVACTLKASGVLLWQSADAISSSAVAGQFIEKFRGEVDSMGPVNTIQCSLYELNIPHHHQISGFVGREKNGQTRNRTRDNPKSRRAYYHCTTQLVMWRNHQLQQVFHHRNTRAQRGLSE